MHQIFSGIYLFNASLLLLKARELFLRAVEEEQNGSVYEGIFIPKSA